MNVRINSKNFLIFKIDNKFKEKIKLKKKINRQINHIL